MILIDKNKLYNDIILFVENVLCYFVITLRLQDLSDKTEAAINGVNCFTTLRRICK